MSETTEDPFDLLEIEPAFDIDLPQVRTVVRRRVAACHPDRFQDPEQQAEAMRQSARLNAAWAAIEDEEVRANALLARLGGPSASADKSLPPDFLQSMLAVRMDMEEALASGDPAERSRVSSWAEDERTRLRESVAALFVRYQAGEDMGTAIRAELNVWRYIERMIEQLGEQSPGSGVA